MHKRTPSARGRLLAALILLVALSSGVALLRLQTGAPTAPAGSSTGKDPDRARYAVNQGENPATEAGRLADQESYWNQRVTYPTGQFNQNWLVQSAAQDLLIPRSIPAGQPVYNRAAGRSPLTLDPNAFTALGPAPLQSNGCQGCYSYGHVSGRVNVMVVDPVTPNVAYLGGDGGGIWKTTTCCTAATSWVPVTDSPNLTSISISDITIDPTDHNTVYAGTGDLNFGSFSYGSAGVLKSTDQGASWGVFGADTFAPPYPQPPGLFPQYQAVGKMRVDPRNHNNVIAGTKTGVFFSADAGTTWSGPCTPDSFTTQRQDVTGMLIRDNGAGTDIYVSVGARGYSTTVQINLGENGANGIYKTTLTAGGCPAAWTLLTTPANGWPAGTGSGTPFHSGGNPLGRIDLAYAPSTWGVGSANQTIYAQVQAIQAGGGTQRGGQLGLWRTTDSGATWQQRSGPSALGGCGMDYGQNWYDQGLAVDPNNADTLFMDTFDIWKSTNGGTTLSDVTCGYGGGNTQHVDEHALVYLPGSSSTLLAGSDGGAYVALNADTAAPTWNQLNDSLNTIEFYSGDITGNFANSANPGANGGAQDNGSDAYQWSGTPGAALWRLMVGGDGFYARIEPVLNQRWYQENNSSHINLSTSGPYGGYSDISGGWLADTRSFTTPYEIYKYDCPATGCTHLIVGSNRVWETTTGTSPWTAISPNLTKNTLADRSFINQLSYAVSLSTTAIIGTNDGNVQYGFGLGQGVAATWIDVSGGNTVLPNRPILDVATHPTNPLIGYAAVGGFDQNSPSTPGHVFQVTCGSGCSSFVWTNKSGNLPNIPIDSIIANPLYPQQVFAGSDWGLYYTNDITAVTPVWNKFSAGLPNVMIWDMQIDRGFTTLSLWTRGRGAYVWPLPTGAIPPGSVTPTPSVTVTSTTQPTATATNTVLPTVTATAQPATSATATAQTTATTQVTTTATAAPPSATRTPPATATPCAIRFSDVTDTSAYYYTGVYYLACRGVVSGYSDGTFKPFNNTTRAQMTKIVTLAFGIALVTPPATGTFADVAPGNVFYQLIETAAARGIVSGYSCGGVDPQTGASEPCDSGRRPYFRPSDFVTRGQLAKIVVIGAGWALRNPPTPTFTDVPTGNVFYPFIETAVCHGAVGGYNDGTFRPNNFAFRGQIAKIVYLALTNPPTTCAP